VEHLIIFNGFVFFLFNLLYFFIILYYKSITLRSMIDPVLMYGPTITLNFDQWMTKLHLGDAIKKQIIKNSKNIISKSLPVEMVDEILKYLKNSEKGNKYNDFLKLLVNNNLRYVFLNDYDHDNCRIGFIVENYEDFSKTDKENVDNFCKKYKLGKPTFYGGFTGDIDGVKLRELQHLYETGYTGQMLRYLYDQKQQIPIEEFKNHVRFTDRYLSDGNGTLALNGKLWIMKNNMVKINDKIRKFIIV